ncbi:hypothetical protein PV08_10195 [Exophiala spinifera]|uniref:Peptidase A1 domain-containing protein n=1 Tax=Exophiala spinifera TaxID=91928 RepID=A0A0D1Y7K4_9EURO|nr:uncharacterized protein PV08_10195 [Exophiala spinifera]KIW10896.1 hypothetical protein PV08_10195 [Exophiala spinifera]
MLSFPVLLLFSSTVSATHLALHRRASNSNNAPGKDASTLTSTLFNTVFDVHITIGSQIVPVLVDTGSSDTYVMRQSFTCINKTTNAIIPRSSCLYGPTLYDPGASQTYQAISNESFGVVYGAGIASGLMATETITLGDLTAHNVTVGVADTSTPMGDGLNVGLLGLAYPALTSAHPGPISNTPNDTFYANRLPYDPIVFTMRDQGLLESPIFSIALARTPQNDSTGFGGYLSLGRLPPVQHDAAFTTVPVEITSVIPLNATSGQRVRSYWTLSVSDVVVRNTSSPSGVSSLLAGTTNASLADANTTTTNTSFQAFVDSGNDFTFLPGPAVSQISSLFSPPAVYDPTSQLYVVDCAAVAPQIGVTIGNDTFFHDGRDLIYQTGEGADGLCVSSIASADSVAIGEISISILGVPFMKNVVSVFDIGNNVMIFAKLKGDVTQGGSGSTDGSSGGNGTGTGTGTGNSTAVPNAATGVYSFKPQSGGHFLLMHVAIAVSAVCVGLGSLSL